MTTGVEDYSGFSDEAVQAGTGRRWRDWITVLNQWDTEEEKRLVPLTRHLVRQYGLSLHWAQVVAVYYHRFQQARA